MMVCVDQQASEDRFRQDLNSCAPSTTGTGQLTGECHLDDGEDDGKNRAVQTVFQCVGMCMWRPEVNFQPQFSGG